MEVRQAFQGALRTATSSTRVTAALLAMRRTTPTAASMIRQQSSAAAAATPTKAAAAKPAQSTNKPTWPTSSFDPNDAANWVRSKPSSSTIGARGANPHRSVNSMLRDLKTSLPRNTPVGDSFAAAAGAMAQYPAAQTFDPSSFMTSHIIRHKEKEWNVRLRPVLGRTVPVAGSVDVAKAFSLLGFLVRRNRVSRDFYSQRFHERGGLRRKRLKSERWRARFKVGFQATVKRVQQLVKQGW